MLIITVPKVELFNDETQKFIELPSFSLRLEHSLISLSKWESKHQKAFLSTATKTPDEIIEYIQAMILDAEVPNMTLERLSQDNLNQINDYIESKQSATNFGMMPQAKGRSEVITSELIYYWMVAFNIPFECENWHLNRLFSLIRICNIKNSKQKKMSRHEIAMRNRELNEQRRAQLGTTG